MSKLKKIGIGILVIVIVSGVSGGIYFGINYTNTITNNITTTISYTPEYEPNFVNTTTQFTLNASDDLVENNLILTQYRFNGGEWVIYSGAFTVASEINGTVIIEYRSFDNTGNTESINIEVVRLDGNNPITNISYLPEYTPNIVNSSTIFTLTANDGVGESELEFTEYELNGGGWLNYTTPFTVASQPNGTVTIKYRSIDNVGNIESTNTEIVRLDSNAPTTSISYTAEYAPDYVNDTTLFTLNPSDGSGESGVAITQYQLNGGGWLIYSVPFTVASQINGTVTISYRSIDNVGNIESTNTEIVRLDGNGPTTNINYIPECNPNIVNESTIFTLTPNDGIGESGIAITEYQLNGGGWLTYSGPFTVVFMGNGTITITYRSVDNADNVESTKTEIVQFKTQADFKVEFIDGMNGSVIPNSKMDWEVYQTVNLNDPLSLELINRSSDPGVEAVEDLNWTKFDQEHLLLKYWGSWGPDYYVRWVQLIVNTTNRVTAFQEPTSEVMFVSDYEGSIGILDVGLGEVDDTVNFTITCYTNKAEPEAVWVKGPDYEDAEYDYSVAFEIDFGGPIGLNDLDIANTIGDPQRIDAQTLRYNFFMLGSGTADFACIWSLGAPSVTIASITLKYGPSSLVVLN